MPKRVLIMAGLLTVAGCTFLRGKGAEGGASAKAANTFHQRYYTIQTSAPGKLACIPNEPLEALIDACDHRLASCRAGMEAAAGRTGPDDEAMFADMIERTATAFAYECVGLSRPATGPENLHLLGLQGLGLMASDAYVDRLIAVDDINRRSEPWHLAMRPDLAFALWQTGDHGPALAKLIELAHLDGTDDATRARVVLHVGRMNSDGVVDLCVKQLQQPANDELAQACTWYAARLRVADIVPMIAKPGTKLGLPEIRALGISGNPKAVEPVTRAMNPLTASDNARVAARVALLNLGKREALRDFVNLIAGNAGPRKAANETPKLPSEELSREAALEVLALQNRAFDKDVTRALRKLTNHKNGETAAAAWIALAYIGNDAAIDKVAQMLAAADDSLRVFILDNIGGRVDEPGRHTASGGGGIVPDGRLSSAIATTYQGASLEAAGRSQAITAMAAIHAATRSAATAPPTTASR